jgi:ADP-ribose pyrophosphatase YjhB (NUDIX family)
MSPGGGLEENESLTECCKREILEETGVIADVGEQLFTINEYVFNELYNTIRIKTTKKHPDKQVNISGQLAVIQRYKTIFKFRKEV